MSPNAQPRDHAGMEVLDAHECRVLLAAGRIGRIAFQYEGEVMIFPITYYMDSSRVCFRSAIGAKLDAALDRRAVAFEIDGFDETARTGWSVIVKGQLGEVVEGSRIAALDEAGAPPWLNSEGMRWMEVIAAEISGRRLPGSSVEPSD
jgi:nitroimidazol reductase NimA-like FMN-containing flavoprotein (pyridoxamine 5'-phosphate oxidase superfamily)